MLRPALALLLAATAVPAIAPAPAHAALAVTAVFNGTVNIVTPCAVSCTSTINGRFTLFVFAGGVDPVYEAATTNLTFSGPVTYRAPAACVTSGTAALITNGSWSGQYIYARTSNPVVPVTSVVFTSLALGWERSGPTASFSLAGHYNINANGHIIVSGFTARGAGTASAGDGCTDVPPLTVSASATPSTLVMQGAVVGHVP